MDFDAKYDRRGNAVRPLSAAEIEGSLEDFLQRRRIERVEILSGGYVHSNLALTLSDGSSCVARIGTRSSRAVETEVSVLRHLAGRIPLPAVLHHAAASNVVVLELVEGDLLARVEDALCPSDLARLGAEIGRTLAAIHAVEFEAPGELAPGPVVEAPFPDFRTALLGYLGECLAKPRLRERLGPDTHRRLERFVAGRSAILDEMGPENRLVHADFNHKNLLVRRRRAGWEVAAVLDWEFAFSASPLCDFGNFLRFEAEQPPWRAPLVEGYREAGGRLPDRWREIARFIDLAAMTNFLTRDDDLPRTFRTAAAVIEATLAGRP